MGSVSGVSAFFFQENLTEVVQQPVRGSSDSREDRSPGSISNDSVTLSGAQPPQEPLINSPFFTRSDSTGNTPPSSTPNSTPVANNTNNSAPSQVIAVPSASSSNGTQTPPSPGAQGPFVQLNQLLQELGLGQQTISVFDLVAQFLLSDAPGAFQSFLQALDNLVSSAPSQSQAGSGSAGQGTSGGSATQTPAPPRVSGQGTGTAGQVASGGSGTPNPAPQPSGQGTGTNPGTTPSSNTGGITSEVLAFQFTLTQAETSTTGDGNGNSHSAKNGNTQIQFQELQVSLAAITVDGSGTSPNLSLQA